MKRIKSQNNKKYNKATFSRIEENTADVYRFQGGLNAGTRMKAQR